MPILPGIDKNSKGKFYGKSIGTQRTPGAAEGAVPGDGTGQLYRCAGVGAAAVLRHPPKGYQPHCPRAAGPLRKPVAGAGRAVGGAEEGAGHQRPLGEPAAAGHGAGPVLSGGQRPAHGGAHFIRCLRTLFGAPVFWAEGGDGVPFVSGRQV